MESAIPAHLQTARTRHRRVGDDYAPPYPSFVARHKPSVTRVVMAYFGLQSRGVPPAAARRTSRDNTSTCRPNRSAISAISSGFRGQRQPDALGPRALC